MEVATKTMSYREMARFTGVAPSTIMRIRKQEVSPDFNTVKIILKAFGCQINIVNEEELNNGKNKS